MEMLACDAAGESAGPSYASACLDPSSSPDVADFSDSNLYHQHYFPGAVSLFEDLDKDVMLDLRDGRKIFGTFRSFDQVACFHMTI